MDSISKNEQRNAKILSAIPLILTVVIWISKVPVGLLAALQLAGVALCYFAATKKASNYKMFWPAFILSLVLAVLPLIIYSFRPVV